MTRCSAGLDAVPTPPYSAELLGDLHAGVMDTDIANQLWPRVQADLDSTRYIESLNAVVDVLGRRGRDLDAAQPMPDWVRNELESSMSDRYRSTAPGSAPAHRPEWTGRRGAMILLAAAAVVGIAVAAVSGLVNGGVIGSSNDHVAVTADGDAAGAIDTKLITESIGLPASGVFADPARLSACLTANGIAGDSRVLGMSDIMIRGREATLIVVPGPDAPTLTAVAVGDRCGDGVADTVSRVELG